MAWPLIANNLLGTQIPFTCSTRQTHRSVVHSGIVWTALSLSLSLHASFWALNGNDSIMQTEKERKNERE